MRFVNISRLPRTVFFIVLALSVASCDTMGSPSGAMYQAAKRQWLGSGLWAGSAAQNLALPIAIRDLRIAESTDRGDKSGYEGAITQLQVIESIPDASVTPEESLRWSVAKSQLDHFFKAPQSAPYTYNCDPIIGRAVPGAAEWNKEPANTTSGVDVGPLRQAIAALRPQARTNPCYAAAIDDLTALESASSTSIAQSYSPACTFTVVGFEILYLNALFQTGALTNPKACQA